jgi:hypothetical protein
MAEADESITSLPSRTRASTWFVGGEDVGVRDVDEDGPATPAVTAAATATARATPAAAGAGTTTVVDPKRVGFDFLKLQAVGYGFLTLDNIASLDEDEQKATREAVAAKESWMKTYQETLAEQVRKWNKRFVQEGKRIDTLKEEEIKKLCRLGVPAVRRPTGIYDTTISTCPCGVLSCQYIVCVVVFSHRSSVWYASYMFMCFASPVSSLVLYIGCPKVT